MKKPESEVNGLSDFVTIGDVKASLTVWGVTNTYKSRERKKGRKLKMPEALCELAAEGAKSLGITE